MLASKGHIVTLAKDGVEAVEKANEQPFDLILMDMHMPRLDGIGATETIRAASGFNKETAIVAFTADALSDHRKLFFEAGVDTILTKPVKIEELQRVLASTMAK